MDYGCIGEHLTHSFSKEIHNMLGILYELREISPEMLGAFVKSKEYSFYNVTIPYKETVIPYMSQLSDTAKKIGSVNTVAKSETVTQTDGFHGDAPSFLLVLIVSFHHLNGKYFSCT